MTFLLACQIAHKVTTILVKSPWSMECIIEKTHWRVEGSVDMLMCSTIVGFERAHTHLDMVHSISECPHELSCPHMEQTLDDAIFLWCRTSPVGSEHCARRHRQTRTFEGTSHFHNFIHH